MPRSFEHADDGALPADAEGGRHRRLLGTGPDHGDVCTAADDQPQCIEKNGLAGSGFTGENRQPIAELEIDAFDDRQIADTERSQHDDGRITSCICAGPGITASGKQLVLGQQ